MLQRLAELGMQLAERTAREALAGQPAGDPADPQIRSTRPDPTIVFLRLSKEIRDTIALEARIADGHIPAAPHEEPEPEPEGDPRRPAIRSFMLHVIDTAPIRKQLQAEIRQELEDLISETIAADPEQAYAGGSIVMAICNKLGLPCDISKMPEELLDPPSVADDLSRLSRGHDPPHT